MVKKEDKITPLFTFKKVAGKWQSYINPQLAFNLITVEGIPQELAKEMIEEQVNTLTPMQRLAVMAASWLVYAKDNNVDLGAIRKDLLLNQEGVRDTLGEINYASR